MPNRGAHCVVLFENARVDDGHKKSPKGGHFGAEADVRLVQRRLAGLSEHLGRFGGSPKPS